MHQCMPHKVHVEGLTGDQTSVSWGIGNFTCAETNVGSLTNKLMTNSLITSNMYTHSGGGSGLHDDVVDWDVDEFHKEANESHDGEPHCSGQCNLLELWKRGGGGGGETVTGQLNGESLISPVVPTPYSLVNTFPGVTFALTNSPFRSGLVQRFTRRIESFAKSLMGFTYAVTCSIAHLSSNDSNTKPRCSASSKFNFFISKYPI